MKIRLKSLWLFIRALLALPRIAYLITKFLYIAELPNGIGIGRHNKNARQNYRRLRTQAANNTLTKACVYELAFSETIAAECEDREDAFLENAAISLLWSLTWKDEPQTSEQNASPEQAD